MKTSPTRIYSTWFGRSPGGALAATLAFAMAAGNAVAQLQTAGTVFVNIDATTLSAGVLANSNIVNSGSLGGVFEANTNMVVATGLGVNGLVMGGTNYLRLLATHAGALIPPPQGLIGSNATCSIEAWVINPQVAGDECIISWGARVAGQNMGFEYGNGTSGGAQHFSADIAWDPIGGGAPLNGYWHHLVYTFDGTNQTLYSDGVLANSQPVTFATATNQGIALGAQWATAAATTPGTTPALATLGIGRLRVHDGALTAAQVLNNFNFEKATFVAAAAPAFLTSGPVHRYSFNQPATNDATGLAILDSVGTANGIIQGSYSNNQPALSGTRLVLPGGIQTTMANYGAPYAAFPPGLISANSTNNAGSGEVSVEVWWKNTGGYTPGSTGNGPWSWSRVFDVGSCGLTTPFPATGVTVTGPGTYPVGGAQLDYLYYTAQVGQGYACVNQRQLGWQNKDSGPGSTGTNSAGASVNVQTMGTFQVDRHVVVTWKESTGQITAYENGVQTASIFATNAISALNDLNFWLGRSLNVADHGFAGEFDEMRVYNYALSQAQALGNYQAGPNTINTAQQAAAVVASPIGVSAYRGWPASFYVVASGSPGVSYQWLRNGSAIGGATSETYSIAAVADSNNGDAYSCVVSNFANATPNTVTSGAGTLTVIPNVAAPPATLHETKEANPTAAIGAQRDDYPSVAVGNAIVGGSITVGSAGALVTHFGFYDVYGDGLNRAHWVGVYSGNTLIASNQVPAGADPSTVMYNGYRYLALSAPLALAPNAVYTIAGQVFNGDGDMWPDVWAPGQWNPYFVGTNGPSSRIGRFSGSPWPAPVSSGGTVNVRYAPANIATLPVGPALVWANVTTVTQYVGVPVTLNVLANGQAPVSCQWYKAPATLLPGQTGLNLVFSNPTLADAGDYYAVVTNTVSPFTAQSPNITLTILGNTPAQIDQQPANLTVNELFPATFAVSVSGTPPISYQWNRNSSPIAGATINSYTIASASLTNNGDAYTCLVSNHTTTANTLISSSATLTVVANQAPPPQILYPSIAANRDNFNGSVGGMFTVGANPAVVSHLGFYSQTGGLNFPHHVGIYNAAGSGALLASVFISSGAWMSNYVWAELDQPLTLAPNTSYILVAEVFSGDGDAWPDVFPPDSWNPYFVGTQPGSSRQARFISGNWPAFPASTSAANEIYAAPNLAILPQGPPIAFVSQTNVYAYVGSNVTVAAFVDGDTPLTVQWYKAPNTQLSGQTKSTLALNNVTTGDSGTYYVVATNPNGSVQSSNVVLTVLNTGAPTILQQPLSQVVYSNQTVYFNVSVAVPPQSYQWNYNNNPIAGATGNVLTIPNATTATNGVYAVTIVNSFGTTNSDPASLTVVNPPAGSYFAAALAAAPMVYYRYTDVTNGTGVAYNAGTAGSPYAGTLLGAFTNTIGPEPNDFPNFDVQNDALLLNGSDVVTAIPALNLSGGPSVTLAAWINANGLQTGFSGIIFNRGTVASGLGVKRDPNNTSFDMLEYHWNSLYFQTNTFLDVPQNKWVFVALAVTSTRAIIYLQDGSGMKSYTNTIAHASMPFDSTTYVGWDTAGAGRRFNGGIDEPMIFNRTLSIAELNALYAASLLGERISITPSGTDFILNWSGGTLQQADAATGPFTDVPGAISPYTYTPDPSAAMKYFRVKLQ